MNTKSFFDNNRIMGKRSYYLHIDKVLVTLKIVKSYQRVDSFLKSNKVYINGTSVHTPWFKVFKGDRILSVNGKKYNITVERGNNPPVYEKINK